MQMAGPLLNTENVIRVCTDSFNGLKPHLVRTREVSTMISPLVQMRTPRFSGNNLPPHRTASVAQSWHLYLGHLAKLMSTDDALVCQPQA